MGILTHNARDLVFKTEQEMWELVDQHRTTDEEGGQKTLPHEVVFDNGERITTSPKRTLISWYAWGLIREFDKIAIKPKHHCESFEFNRFILNSTMDAINEDIFEVYGQELDRDNHRRVIMDIVNQFYNAFVEPLEEWVTSINIIDFIEVNMHPKIQEIIATMEENSMSIEAAYKKAKTVLFDKTFLPDNSLVEAVHTGVVRINQVLQCIIARGSMTDIDHAIFRKPIMECYLDGIPSYYGSLIESRSASHSHIATGSNVKDAETFNRVQQLLCSYVMGFVKQGDQLLEDCGSDNYHDLQIDKQRLSTWEGTTYIDRETGVVSKIKASDKHLIGKIIGVRTIHDCKSGDPQRVCLACYGDMHRNIPTMTNIGQFGAVNGSKNTSQLIISTKHYDANAIRETMRFDEEEGKFIRIGKNGDQAFLIPDILKKATNKSIVFSVKEAPRLSDIRVGNIDALKTTSITQLSSVLLVFYLNKKRHEIPIRLTIGTQCAHFSRAMLKQLHDKGWSTNEKGNHYYTSLDGWNFKDPIVDVPAKRLSTMDFFEEVRYVVESSSKAGKIGRVSKHKNMKDSKDPFLALLTVEELINGRFDVHICHLQVMVHAARTNLDLDPHDYSIPDHTHPGQLDKTSTIIKNRSLGPAALYDGFADNLMDPNTVLVTERMPSNFDPTFLGNKLP
jgi:hypothetical protein